MLTQAETRRGRIIDLAILFVAINLFWTFPFAILLGGLWFVAGAGILLLIVAIAAVEMNRRLPGFSAWQDAAPKMLGISLIGWFQLVVAWIGGGLGLIAKWLMGG